MGVADAGRPGRLPAAGSDLASVDPARGSSRVARVLWAIRWKVGGLLGWDDPATGIGSRVPTLRDRLPEDLRGTASADEFETLPFKPLYRLDDEWAAEIANRTVHGVLHLGWVPDGAAGYRGELAVYVKPNGRLGRVYLAAIMPFRHVLVYPALLRDLERRWQTK